MADNYSNELVEVDGTSVSKRNGGTDENTLQLMQNFTSTIIGLSQQVSENNAAKYKAQAEVMIAQIQAKMQEECQDMNGYYNKREQQGASFDRIIMIYQEQLKDLTNAILAGKSESQIGYLKSCVESYERKMSQLLDFLANDITGEQNRRLETSKSRSKGLFGFFRRG